MLLVPFLVALQLALAAITIAMTISNYASLPERIPIHFNFAWKPDGYGPKATAWLLPAIQLFVMCIGAVAYESQTAAGKTPLWAPLAVISAVLLMLAATQWQIIETAKHGPSGDRARFLWALFAATLVVIPIAAYSK